MNKNTGFVGNEAGAVTVDWVVLTAGLVGLGLAAMGVVSTGTEDLSGDIETQLKENHLLNTTFSEDPVAASTFAKLTAYDEAAFKTAYEEAVALGGKNALKLMQQSLESANDSIEKGDFTSSSEALSKSLAYAQAAEASLGEEVATKFLQDYQTVDAAYQKRFEKQISGT